MVLEASMVAQRDWVVFVDVQRRCMQDLVEFGIEVWPLAIGRLAVARRTVSSCDSGAGLSVVVWECSTLC